jgi:hypothetical protein
MKRPIAIAVAVLAAAGLAATTAGLGHSARTVPAKKTAWFQLVFEGTAQADRVGDEGGAVGAGCLAQVHVDIDEDVTFGRGKGVVMEFVEYGPNRYGFQRLGRTGDASFNVVSRVTRRASGSADIVQDTHLPAPCPILRHDDLSKNPDCGKPKTVNATWGLKVEGNHFRPAPAKTSFGLERVCGDPPEGSPFSEFGQLFYRWPLPPAFIWEPIPYAKMFNPGYKAFKVDFQTLPKPNTRHSDRGGIGLVWTDVDHGTAQGTVRFIRCFPKAVAKVGQPPC